MPTTKLEMVQPYITEKGEPEKANMDL